jgi:hypothetical protein
VRLSSHSLLPREPLPDRHNDINRPNRAHSLPSPLAPPVLVLDHPAEGDEPVVQPVELEQGREEEDHGRVDEERVHWAFEGKRVESEGGVDRDSTKDMSEESGMDHCRVRRGVDWGDAQVDHVEEKNDLGANEELQSLCPSQRTPKCLGGAARISQITHKACGPCSLEPVGDGESEADPVNQSILQRNQPCSVRAFPNRQNAIPRDDPLSSTHLGDLLSHQQERETEADWISQHTSFPAAPPLRHAPRIWNPGPTLQYVKHRPVQPNHERVWAQQRREERVYAG